MGFRKRRVATPSYGHTPYNPMRGNQATLRQDGTYPYCVLMQVAAEDTYTNHVICRGFDTRMLRFVDYEEGNADKPGISVAKPFGSRVAGIYKIGEVYPVFLPTQGNADIGQAVYVPPSPDNVHLRFGQNPGYVVSGSLNGGHPSSLSNTIGVLYDHNSNVINWLLIDSGNPRIKHVKTGGSSIAAFDTGTLTMSSGTVTEYACSSSGVLSSTSNTFTAYNPGGLIAANSYAVVEMNEAGLWIFIVVKCA